MKIPTVYNLRVLGVPYFLKGLAQSLLGGRGVVAEIDIPLREGYVDCVGEWVPVLRLGLGLVM